MLIAATAAIVGAALVARWTGFGEATEPGQAGPLGVAEAENSPLLQAPDLAQPGRVERRLSTGRVAPVERDRDMAALSELAKIRPDVARALTVVYPDGVEPGVAFEFASVPSVVHDMAASPADPFAMPAMKVDPRRRGATR